MCDCLERQEQQLKEGRELLDGKSDLSCEQRVERHSYVNPDFVVALECQGLRRELIRALAAEIPENVVREAVANGEITSEQGDAILLAASEHKTPWYVKLWKRMEGK